MMQPPLDVGITFTKPSQWVWHVSFDGKHIGTVNGDDSCGFIARDIDYRSIGHGYVSADAAILACAPVMEPHYQSPRRLSLSPRVVVGAGARQDSGFAGA
jgi:hypothetical protein